LRRFCHREISQMAAIAARIMPTLISPDSINDASKLGPRPLVSNECSSSLTGAAPFHPSSGTGMVILITVDAIANPPRILTMLLVRITGSQLRAGRALAGLTIEDLAACARLCRHSVRKWEGSSNAVPDAMVGHLSRALDVLEAEGIRFTDGGVRIEARAAPSSIS
jgi:hypothetical protein